MFGVGLLVILALGASVLVWATARLPGMKMKASFLLLAVGGLALYSFAYKFSTSYASFQALCEMPDRYRVVRTKQVDFLYLSPEEGADCKAGPTFIGNLSYAGFECTAPTSTRRAGLFRYTKKPGWREDCDLDCFDSAPVSTPEVNYKKAYRQGYISGTQRTAIYGNGLVNTPDDEKLRFQDTVILDASDEMAFTRSYTYYPYGNGWAKLLGASSGSAPSMRCKNDYIQWNVLDVYKPRAGS